MLLTSADGQESQEGKVERLVGLYKDILIGKTKAAGANKSKYGICSPLPIGGQP